MQNFHRVIFSLFLLINIRFYAQIEVEIKEVEVSRKSTIRSRFQPPEGYFWETAAPHSFQEFLINFPLKPNGFPVRDFRDIPLPKQYHHAAVLDIDVGKQDLQQCADAWIRLYAEFLWLHQRYDEIAFEFTSQQKLSWNDYKKGVRTREDGALVQFYQTGYYNDSYQNFRKYMDLVFQYAGTISLDRETRPLLHNREIKVGDIIIKPGSPGHSVFIVGSARNKAGKRVFLLAESFMPAQDIHILKNPLNARLSPWYQLDINARQLITPKYFFRPVSIKRFYLEK